MITAQDMAGIKARVDILDVVSQYVPNLHQAGRNFKACCPFHQEQTPSFTVFPESQTWHCFGECETGGDVVLFVMRATGKLDAFWTDRHFSASPSSYHMVTDAIIEVKES